MLVGNIKIFDNVRNKFPRKPHSHRDLKDDSQTTRKKQEEVSIKRDCVLGGKKEIISKGKQ